MKSQSPHSWWGRGHVQGILLWLVMSSEFYNIPTGTIQSYRYYRYRLALQKWFHGESSIDFGKVGVGLRCGFELDAQCSNPTIPLARLWYVGTRRQLIWKVRCIVPRDWPTKSCLQNTKSCSNLVENLLYLVVILGHMAIHYKGNCYSYLYAKKCNVSLNYECEFIGYIIKNPLSLT